jgi:hypothetical protein
VLPVPFGVSKVYVNALYGGSSYINASSINSEVAINKSSSFLAFLPLPSEILAGTELKIYVELTDINGSPIINSPLDGKFLFEPGALESPAVEHTDSFGIAEFTIYANPLFQTVQITIDYSGSVNYESTSISSGNLTIITLSSSLNFTYLPSSTQAGSMLKFAS